MVEALKTNKKSIRFFNDREVRAVWDDENNCWWFSATDVVRAINNEPDYVKAGNYWLWLKRRLRQEGIELVSAAHEFKLLRAGLFPVIPYPLRRGNRRNDRTVPDTP